MATVLDEPVSSVSCARLTPRQQKEKLQDHCEWRCLSLGRYAIVNKVRIDEYLVHYGLSVEILDEILRYDRERFVLWFGTTTVAGALSFCQEKFGLQPKWVPRHIHVYETLRKKYPKLRWEVDEEMKVVRLINYPWYILDGVVHWPCLYELLLDRVTVDPRSIRGEQPPKKQKKEKAPLELRRRDRRYMGAIA